jgi:2-polyprenyl-3-methyl-5-hydroxy-6-metoxy-1,4-benzoquinol methylase
MNTNQYPIELEERRLVAVETIEDYSSFHERHRIFPAVFEERGHQRILDSSAGVGCAAQRIHKCYSAELVCNDISPTCLRLLSDLGLSTVSFDLDASDKAYPFEDGEFDAVISLATIEHLLHVDHFLQEIHRILSDDGYFYLSTPNYASLLYFRRFVLNGRTFHNPLSENSRYEFYAHLRYFTYRTLLEYVSAFGFIPDTVYLTLPEGSTRYRALLRQSPLKASMYRNTMRVIYAFFSPRWASEPVICFRKGVNGKNTRPRKVVL